MKFFGVFFLWFTSLALVLGQSGRSDPKNDEALRKAAFGVDQLVAEIFRSKKLTVPSVVDDPTFLRRSFLVAAGRIPTLEEASSFLEIDDEGKRAMLIDYLLQGDGYRSHMQNYVFDLLRASDGANDGAGSFTAPYLNFIQESVAQNLPWNEFARRLIAAEGFAWDEGNGAVGYFIRDKGMPLDNLSITMQIFTGERLECAQCHDSPTNKWERIDFYELAAFTHGQSEIKRNVYNEARRSYPDEGFDRTDIGRLYRWLRDNLHHGSLSELGRGRIELPSDYQYRDGKPGEVVGGKTHFGKRIRSSDRRDSGKSRVEFAQWMTEENPNFDYVIVNRMWERVMGSPLTNPVDEYVAPEATASPALVNYLTRLMKDLNYDLRSFQKVLFLTKTFQFAANPEAFEAGVPQAFNGRQLVRMSAEQMWDSLVTLVAHDPEQLPKRRFNNHIYYQGKPVLVGKKTMADLAQEIRTLRDGDAYRKWAENLLQQIQQDRGSSAGNDEMMMMAANSRPGPAQGIARASELSAPAPANHFLREFGQSDRELIGAETKEPNVAQTLEIMNGHVEKMVVSNGGAAVYDALKKGTTQGDKTRYIYYAILSRPPSDEEMRILMRDVIDGSEESYQNLVSALVSTHEFMFIQ